MHRPVIGYTHVAAEAVALLSWLAGFIAVAISIASDICPPGNNSCHLLEATTVFAAFDWLLFMVTAFLTTRSVLQATRGRQNTYQENSIPPENSTVNTFNEKSTLPEGSEFEAKSEFGEKTLPA